MLFLIRDVYQVNDDTLNLALNYEFCENDISPVKHSGLSRRLNLKEL